MRRQINVMLEEAELGEIEKATPGIDGGVAVRVAALSFARGLQTVKLDAVVHAPVVQSDGVPGSEGGAA